MSMDIDRVIGRCGDLGAHFGPISERKWPCRVLLYHFAFACRRRWRLATDGLFRNTSVSSPAESDVPLTRYHSARAASAMHRLEAAPRETFAAPSSSIFTSAAPELIMGSMVMTIPARSRTPATLVPKCGCRAS